MAMPPAVLDGLRNKADLENFIRQTLQKPGMVRSSLLQNVLTTTSLDDDPTLASDSHTAPPSVHASKGYTDAGDAAEATARAGGDASTLTSAETYADTGDATEAAARAAAISTEATTRASADSAEAVTRASAITTEASARSAGDAATLTAAETYADTGDATEATARAAAVSSEATTRAAADTAEASSRTAGDAATLTSAESYADSHDATTLASAHTYADTGDATEATARAAADSAEATTRAAADTTNATAITSEATTRAAADTTNATAITSEATTRASADTTEATARAAGDSTNATAITTEATTRAAADTTNAAAAAAAQTTANAALPALSLPTARKTATESVNNSSTLQDDDELFIALAASSYYSIDYTLLLGAGFTTADWLWGFTYSGSMTTFKGGPLSSSSNGIWGGVTTAQTPAALSFTSISDTYASGSAGISTGGLVLRIVAITNTAGTLKLQWAQNTPIVSNSQVLPGSIVIGIKV